MEAKRGFLQENRLENEEVTPFLLQVRQKDLLMEKGSYTNKSNFMDFTCRQCFNDGGDWYDIKYNQMGFVDITIKTLLSSYVYAPRSLITPWSYAYGNTVNPKTLREIENIHLHKIYKKRGFFKNHKDGVNLYVYSDYKCGNRLDISDELSKLSWQPLYVYRPPHVPEIGEDEHPEDIGWWYYSSSEFRHLNEKKSNLIRDIRLPLDIVKCGSIIYSNVDICHILDDNTGLTSSMRGLLAFDGITKNGLETNSDDRNITRVLCTLSDTSNNEYGISEDGYLNYPELWNNVYTSIHIIACTNNSIMIDSSDQKPINW